MGSHNKKLFLTLIMWGNFTFSLANASNNEFSLETSDASNQRRHQQQKLSTESKRLFMMEGMDLIAQEIGALSIHQGIQTAQENLAYQEITLDQIKQITGNSEALWSQELIHQEESLLLKQITQDNNQRLQKIQESRLELQKNIIQAQSTQEQLQDLSDQLDKYEQFETNIQNFNNKINSINPILQNMHLLTNELNSLFQKIEKLKLSSFSNNEEKLNELLTEAERLTHQKNKLLQEYTQQFQSIRKENSEILGKEIDLRISSLSCEKNLEKERKLERLHLAKQTLEDIEHKRKLRLQKAQEDVVQAEKEYQTQQIDYNQLFPQERQEELNSVILKNQQEIKALNIQLIYLKQELLPQFNYNIEAVNLHEKVGAFKLQHGQKIQELKDNQALSNQHFQEKMQMLKNVSKARTKYQQAQMKLAALEKNKLN